MSLEAPAINPIENIKNADPIGKITNLGRNTGEAVTSAVSNLKQTSSEIFDSFRNNRYVSGTADFLESNSAIAKIAFLLLVLIVFTFVLRLATNIIHKYFAPSPNPILINGLKRGNQSKIINQHPRDSESVTILRSNNQRGGIEFTWNTWLFIENLDDYKLKHVFHKGDREVPLDTSEIVNQCPGLYVQKNQSSNEATLNIKMSTFDNPIHADIVIPNIPIQKWFNVTIRVKDVNLDVYVNNNIVHRHIFSDAPPKQNYGSVYVSQNNGFDGLISNLRYFNRAITGIEVANIVKQGANLKSADGDSLSINPPYLSMRWYLPQE